MRKLFFIAIAVMIAMAGSHTTASADDVIVSHRGKDGKKEFLKVDHTQLPELQKAMRESRPLDAFKSSVRKAAFRDPEASDEPQEGFKVLFAVEDEETPGRQYNPWKVYVCKGDGHYGRAYYNYSYYPDEETIAQGYAWGCYVPEGEYTVILASDLRMEDPDGGEELLMTSYVVKENVKIAGDTTITFRQSDAKNKLSALCHLPDGSLTPDSNEIYDENGNYLGERKDSYVGFSRSIVNINGDYSLNLGNYDSCSDFVYINDISENWVYAINMTAVDSNGIYVNCVRRQGPFTTSTVMENNPEEYVRTTARFNPNYPGTNPDVKCFGVESKLMWKGADWNLGVGGMVFDALGITDEIPIYINQPESDMKSPLAFDITAAPVVATNKETVLTIDWDGNPFLDENGQPIYYDVYSLLKGPAIYRNADNTYMCIDGYGFDMEEFPEESFLLPYDELFSFEKTTETLFFTGAPILSVYADSFIREGYSRFNIEPTFYYPCLASSSLPYKFTASYNGQNIVEDVENTSFNWLDWSLENYKTPGKIDVTVSSVWDSCDENATLTNTLHIDTGNDDYFVPQVERWQLRDGEGNLSEIATPDSHILLMCHEDCDMDFKITASIKELKDYECTLEKVRQEPFYEFGTWLTRKVFRISLSDFPGMEGEKYSLVFNLSDASGNVSEQTIGHAFEWAGQSGIDATEQDNGIFVSDGIIHAPSDALIYTIDGRKVDGKFLTPGIYIVNSKNNTVKVMVK